MAQNTTPAVLSKRRICPPTGHTSSAIILMESSACEWTATLPCVPCAVPLTLDRGAFATFATDGTNFSEYFPGIKPHLLTLGT